jgi:uncharacterized protein (UPF0248 family)
MFISERRHIIKMVFETLNRLKWTNKLAKAKIVFVHRGAKDDRKTISGRKITSVKRSHFCYKDNDQETFIPNHRVLEIIMEGETLWKRKGR